MHLGNLPVNTILMLCIPHNTHTQIPKFHKPNTSRANSPTQAQATSRVTTSREPTTHQSHQSLHPITLKDFLPNAKYPSSILFVYPNSPPFPLLLSHFLFSSPFSPTPNSSFPPSCSLHPNPPPPLLVYLPANR